MIKNLNNRNDESNLHSSPTKILPNSEQHQGNEKIDDPSKKSQSW